MNDPENHEPLLPQVSLSWLIGLVTASAVAMGIFQQAIFSGAMWAMLSAVAIAAVVVPLLFYAGTFSLASLFSTIGSAAVGVEEPRPVHSPTTSIPDRGMVPGGFAAAAQTGDAEVHDDVEIPGDHSPHHTQDG